MSGRLSDQSYDLIRLNNAAASKRKRKYLSYVRVPNSIALTPRVLSEAMRMLPTEAIHKAVDVLIDELDYRYGDPDFEPEPMEDEDSE